MRLILFICLSTVMLARPVLAASALDVLAKNREVRFALSVALVQEQPAQLLYLSALKGESPESLRELSRRVDAIARHPVSVKLIGGEFQIKGKGSGLRVSGYSPQLTLSYRGQHWVYQPGQSADQNYASLATFLGRRNAQHRSLFAEQAYAADAIDALGARDAEAGWGSTIGGAVAGAQTFAVVGGVAGGLPGVVGGSFAGAVIGAAGVKAATRATGAKNDATAICAFLKSKNGQDDLLGLRDVTYSCGALNERGRESSLVLTFKNASRKASFTIKNEVSRSECCEVRLSEPQNVVLGRVNADEYAEIKKGIKDCDKPETLAEVQKSVRQAYDSLASAAGFCAGTAAGAAGGDGTGAGKPAVH